MHLPGRTTQGELGPAAHEADGEDPTHAPGGPGQLPGPPVPWPVRLAEPERDFESSDGMLPPDRLRA